MTVLCVYVQFGTHKVVCLLWLWSDVGGHWQRLCCACMCSLGHTEWCVYCGCGLMLVDTGNDCVVRVCAVCYTQGGVFIVAVV